MNLDRLVSRKYFWTLGKGQYCWGVILTIFVKICDDEGNLVYSKLQIQQNLNEQKTGQELNAVLALRKQKSVGDQLGEQQHAF